MLQSHWVEGLFLLAREPVLSCVIRFSKVKFALRIGIYPDVASCTGRNKLMRNKTRLFYTTGICLRPNILLLEQKNLTMQKTRNKNLRQQF